MAEIERKWRLAKAPQGKRPFLGSTFITQGYLFTDGGELRLRVKDGGSGGFFLTIKGDGALTREEWEQEIPGRAFEALWKHVRGRKISKTRHSIQVGDRTLELDSYSGDLDGLITLECEFPDEASADAFELPAWAVEAGAVDITTDMRYKSKNLALAGIPLVP